MTNDDLTPEEREALSGLPRERTPSAGLEDRVVAAMRERGHIARQPARVVRITNTRVAGLLAACVVLMIGAYSIGLNRGVDNEVLNKVAVQDTGTTSSPPARDEEVRLQPPTTLGKVEVQETPATTAPEAQFVEKKAPAFEPRLNTPQLVTPKDTRRKTERAKADEVTESMAKSFSDRLSSETDQAPAPALKPAAPMQLQSGLAANESAANRSRSFALQGGTLVVDAPDSVRVVQDAQGRTLLIYTSEGVIRIRLAD